MSSEHYVLKDDLKVLCCDYGPIKKGEIVSLWKQTSKNRCIVQWVSKGSGTGLHKVKFFLHLKDV